MNHSARRTNVGALPALRIPTTRRGPREPVASGPDADLIRMTPMVAAA